MDILKLLKDGALEAPSKAIISRIKAVEDFTRNDRQALTSKIEACQYSDPVSPSFVIQMLAEVVDCECVIVSVSPSSEGMAVALIRPASFFAQNGAGYLGWGLPASLGVNLAMPTRKVICLLGDGGFMFGPQALWTAARYKLPVLTIVLNNRAYLVDRSKKMIQENCFIGTELGEPDMNFAYMAESMGVRGFRINRPTEVRDVLSEAWSLNQPVLVDALVSCEISREFLHR